MNGKQVAGGSTGWVRHVLAIGSRPDDDPDLRVRKRTAVAAVYAAIGAGIFYAALGIAADRPIVTALSVAQAAAQVAALAWFARTGRIAPMVVIVIVVGLLTIASGIVTFGGIQHSNGNVMFALLMPIVAVLVLGRRGAVPAFAAFVVLVLWAAITDPIWRDLASPIPAELGVSLYAMNVIVAGGIALGMVVFIDGERVRAKRQAESLLLNVLPQSIVARLNAGERVIADHCPEVSVLFSDVVDFTPFAERQPPELVVAVLDDLFSAFDRLAQERGLEKIKTIGDAYMVVAGVPQTRPDHAEVLVDMALAMHRVAGERAALDGHSIQLRSGIATGPVVAGIIGRQKFSYDLWGDTVNLASRMESSGVPGCIQVSPATWERVAHLHAWQVREGIEDKGKGPMRTYVLDPSQQVQPVSLAQPAQQ